jgi:hypothetical protein
VRALDDWLLSKMGTSLTLAKLYSDIAETCRARLRLAEDKQAKAKKSKKQDIEAVAKTIAESVRPLLEAKCFPEGFFSPSVRTIRFQFSREDSLVAKVEPLMSEAVVTVRDGYIDQVLLDKSYPRSVAEVIVRSLLMGRREFTNAGSPRYGIPRS